MAVNAEVICPQNHTYEREYKEIQREISASGLEGKSDLGDY
jgi:hypothetical protein